MAKTIKFNLICDNKPVRTIEDLQNNFSIEDVLAYYDNRLLHRWLEVRDYRVELEKVRAITADRPVEVVKALVKIFNVVSEDKKIEEGVYILEYLKKKKKSCAICEKQEYKRNHVIDHYFRQYQSLKCDILEHKGDMAFLKACCNELATTFYCIFSKDYFNFINYMFEECPMFIYAMLTNLTLRKYLLIDEAPEYIFSEIDKKNIELINKRLLSNEFYYAKNIDKILSNNVHRVVGKVTGGYWREVEPKGKKIMVIRAGEGIHIRSAGKRGEQFLNHQYMSRFLMLNGLDFKCNASNESLRYMEV